MCFHSSFSAEKTRQNICNFNPISCNFSPNVLATLWRDKLHETFHSLTYPATAKIVARQVARKVEPSNGSCNLFCNDFGRYRVCYTVKCFLQLVLPQRRQHIARQVARNISQCNGALRKKLLAWKP